MTQFWREGHLHTGPDGRLHWVDGHYVRRDTWAHSPPISEERRRWLAGVSWSRRFLDEGHPNAWQAIIAYHDAYDMPELDDDVAAARAAFEK